MSSEEIRFIIEYGFYGVLLFQFIYNFIVYGHFADKSNLFYSLYIFVIAFCFLNIEFGYVDFLKPTNISLKEWQIVSSGIFEPLIYITYFFFAKSFLESKKDMPKVNSLINIMISISSTEIILPYILFWLGQSDFALFIHFICKPINIAFAIYTFVAFFKDAKVNLLTRYVFVGGIILLLGNMAYHLSKTFTPFIFNHYFKAQDFLRISFLLDLLVFSSGLAYKYRSLIKKRSESIHKEINTLIKTKQENLELEKVLDINIENKIIEIERSNKLLLEIALEQQLLDLQKDLLQAQMNPHLLFNSLSSIKAAVLEENLDNASKYLLCYAQMLRNMIVQSKKRHITIEEEHQSILNYLELEKTRFNDDLFVHFIIEDSVNKKHDLISPMLIQPFIENALWHGLKPKKYGKKELYLCFKKNEDILIVEIKDNGVGRKDKRTLKKYKSRSLSIIEKRMAILNKLYNISAFYDIKDLKNDNGTALGTLVELQIPPLVKTI